MRIAVSGSTGLIGSVLVPALAGAGHEVARLVRTRPGPESNDIYWDPYKAYLDTPKLEGVDAVVHLAGETIAAHWTPSRKRRIHESRIRGTHVLSEALRQLDHQPQVLVSGSAIGFYGDRGEEVVTEESPAGSGFVADVCRDWEAATEPASRVGIRVVHLRTGVVLSSQGGALAKMLPPFRMGVGGKIGSGRQYFSWVSMDDVVSAVQFILRTPALAGPLNMVSPNAATNLEFTKALGKVLSRPTIFPLPSFVVRLLFGQMGEEVLLGGQRVEPAKLKAAGFAFQYPELAPALRHALSA